MADSTDPSVLHDALTGVTAAFLVCGETPARPAFENAFIDAAAAHDVHVVKLSALGAAADAPTFLRWHHTTETHLRASGATWTVLRANSLMDNLLRNDRHTIAAGQWRSTLGSARVSLLAGTDLADVATAVLTNPVAHAGRVYELTGPEPLTGQQIANIASDVLDHPVTVIDTTPQQLGQALRQRGTPDYLAEGITEVHAHFRAGHAAAVTDTVEKILHRPATNLADYLRTHHAAFVSPSATVPVCASQPTRPTTPDRTGS